MRNGRTCCFSEALHAAKHGQRIARAGWNGKGMFIFVVNHVSAPITVPERAASFYPEKYTPVEAVRTYRLEPFICMKTADDKMVPWLASQTDILAEDWAVLD